LQLSVVFVFEYESFFYFTNIFTNIIICYIVVAVCQYLLRYVSGDGEQDVHVLMVKITNFGHAIPQLVICFPPIAAGVQFQIRSYGICGAESGVSIFQFPLQILIPPTAPHSL
jgi:hypothetical protein